MSDTHINAYYGEVEEKKQAVREAEAELQASEHRLADKKRELGIVDKPSTKSSEKEESAETSAEEKPKPGTGLTFGKKK